jgi:hypothetical protein
VDPLPPWYSPFDASPLALALTKRAAYAAATFSGFPCHVFKTVDYNALPYENVNAHGFGHLSLFIAFKFNDASSSDYPPDKKTTPGKAGTIVLDKVLTVYQAIYSAVALSGQLAPGVTMFGFNKRPSIKSLCSNNYYITAENTLSDTSAHSSILWVPSWRISGSIIGASPFY